MAASPNDTVITAGNGSITDANGNVWTVANGQIDVNGTPDPTTANVIEAAFVDGNIWQENASDLWWMKTKPSDTWLPGAGTSTSPLPVSMSPITLTWVGGPDNAASNPKDWSPNAAPQQGDTLNISSGTINVTDNDLAGNPLTLIAPNTTQPFQDFINLANGTARLTDGGDSFTLTTSDSVATKFVGGNGVGLTGDIALAANTTVTMTGSATFLFGLAVAGGTSTLVNDGTVGLTNATISADLDGTGSFNLTRYHDGPGAVFVNDSVGSGLTFNLNGGAGFDSSLTIAQPSTFAAHLVVPANGPDGKQGQDIVHLQGLTATSYTLSDDTLTLFNGTSSIDTLKLTNSLPLEVSQDSNGVGLYFNETAPNPALPIGNGSNPPLPNPPFPPPTTPANFTITDMTDMPPVTGTSAGQPYSGPVQGIDWQLIDITPDKLNITANVPNVFIHSGAGEDALDVSAVNGTNVLDGSTGSNFLTGGSGDDTFFVDDRVNTPTSQGVTGIWSTVNGFHSGDNATVWGITPQDFNITTADNMGAGAAKGLTWDFAGHNGTDAKLTLAGFSSADLASGKLTVSFGEVGGSNYLLVHGT